MIRKSALLWILLLAAILRLYGLADESLWLDEAYVADRISQNYKSMLTDWDSHRQGPIYTLITKTWCDWQGNDEFNLRFTAVVFGIIAVLFIFLLGKELFGERAGLFAALFAALSPFAIHYSQDARPYTLFLLCSIASILYFARILRGNGQVGNQLGFILFASAALYSHAYGPFLVCTFVFCAVGYWWTSKETSLGVFRKIIWGATTVAILYLPMLFIFARTFLRKIDNPKVAGAWLQSEPIIQIAHTIAKYFMGFPLGIAACCLIGIMLSRKLLKDRSVDYPLIAVASILVSFLLIPWIISVTITPIYGARYTIPALGALLVLLGYVMTLLPTKLDYVILSGLVLLNTIPLFDMYTKVDKDPWRQTVNHLEANIQSKDMLLLIPSYARSPFQYYYKDRDDILFKRVRRSSEFKGVPSNIDRVWMIASYYNTPSHEEALFDTLSNWGLSDSTIIMKNTLEMNPNRYFAANIELTRFDRK